LRIEIIGFGVACTAVTIGHSPCMELCHTVRKAAGGKSDES
jgi:hypothetical protein